jgi:hypothetical protein
MAERRKTERRTNPAVPEPLERRRDRRAEERRESTRRATQLVVKSGAAHYPTVGELGLGGASFKLPVQPAKRLIIVLSLEGRALTLPANVISGRSTKSGFEVHVTFEELGTPTELAVAKWLDGA